MPKTKPFDSQIDRYERWFEEHPFAYQSELRAVQELLPKGGRGIEIGVGTGRFAGPLGIRYGIEPSHKMAHFVRKLDIQVVGGQAEKLSFKTGGFDFAIMVTVICFLDDVPKALQETNRILRTGGSLLIGFIDRGSFLGRQYEKNKAKSLFFAEATFYTVDEVRVLLQEAGFTNFVFRQTIFQELDTLRALERIEEGFGQGAFVVVRGVK
jgi:SAM-dependent methyltransferase